MVEPITDRPDAIFASGRRVFVGTPSGTVARDRRELVVRSTRPFKGGLIVHFEGIEGRDEAEKWRGRFFLVPGAELPPLEPDEVYVHDLYGMRVELADGANSRRRGSTSCRRGSPRLERTGAARRLRGVAVVAPSTPSAACRVDPPPGLLDCPERCCCSSRHDLPHSSRRRSGYIPPARPRGGVQYRVGPATSRTTAPHGGRYPYGGPGMVMKPGPFFEAVEALGATSPIVLLSPRGRVFGQADAVRFAAGSEVTFLCGHYKDVDQRVAEHLATEELSLGDFVLSGGEPAALAMIDATVRLLPGAMSDLDSARSDSFWERGLSAPSYTRPPEFRGHTVPDVLLSGDHKRIARWREDEGTRLTLLPLRERTLRGLTAGCAGRARAGITPRRISLPRLTPTPPQSGPLAGPERHMHPFHRDPERVSPLRRAGLCAGDRCA